MTTTKISEWLAEAELGPPIKKRKSLKARKRCGHGRRWDPNKKKCVRVDMKQRNVERRKDRMNAKRSKAKRRRDNRQRNRVSIGAVKPKGDLKRLSTFVLLALRNQALKAFDTKTTELVQTELKRRGLARKHPMPDRSFNPWKD